MAEHPVDGRGVEQVGVVFERWRPGPSASSVGEQGQVELGRPAVGVERRRAPARATRGPAAGRSGGRTSPGRAASGSGRGRAGARRRAARTAGPGGRRPRGPPCGPGRAARGSSGRPRGRPRRTRVLTKKPISPSSSDRVRPGDRRADGEVVLAGVAVQQDLEGREQGHEERRPLLPAQRPEPVERAPSGRTVDRARRPRRLERGRPGPVGRAAPGSGTPVELARPVVELRLEDLALEPVRAARRRSRRTGAAARAGARARPSRNAS